ncbi:MAG: DNA polymerase III subunit beta [Kiritimatiellae bacterium]|nr:DNA polymerase III subunit beta [Kiritimatiellia bacterium]
MKFKVIRSNFLEGLKSVQNIVAGKGTLAILQNVLIEAHGETVVFTTTDLDISVKSEVKCDVIEEGETTLPVKLLFTSTTKMAEGEIEVEVDGQEKATIRAGSARFKLQGMGAEEFPKLPSEGESQNYRIGQAALREMLRKTAYAASQDDTRRTLKGVLMSFKDEKLTMVATDGRRLALVEKELEFPKSDERDIVLPSKAVAELQRSLTGEGEIEVAVQRSQISFELGTIRIFSKLIEETYPNYRQVIPTRCANHIVVDRQALLEALDRASVMTMDEAHSTKLTFESNCLTVSSAASEIGEAKDEVPIKYAGERIDIMFNPTYVMDTLKAIDDDEVSIDINDGHSPAVIKCSIPFLYVLMPLRVS